MDGSSNKRPRSLSSDNTISPEGPSESQAASEVVAKKPKTGDEDADTKVILHSTEGLSQELRTAFALQRALKLSSKKIPKIGYTMTAYERKNRPSKTHQKILRELRALYDETPIPYKSGKLNHLFNLSITRSDCEYNGTVNEINASHLETWYKNGVISGYGDNRALETKIDDSVRDAREIVSDEFSVDEQLLQEVRSIWKENFDSHANVRVSPYKIHLYGPGGHFKSHRDTPEEGLIGTFLVGLGETSNSDEKGCFHIGDESYRADPGLWVAFYPDIPHSISVLPSNHFRASIAFKIFSCGDSKDNPASTQQLQLQSRVEALLHAIPRPFGILLDHEYHLGITELNGYDKILLSGAQTRPDSIVHLLPVIISTSSVVWRGDYDSFSEASYDAAVIPFHPAHVDILNNRSTPAAEQAVEFLKPIRNVPFFCRDFKGTAGLWHRETEQGGYTGNESRGDSESSLYLSHALLVLPAVGDKDSEEDSTSGEESDGTEDNTESDEAAYYGDDYLEL